MACSGCRSGRPAHHCSSSGLDVKTELSLAWRCRWTGRPSSFSQRWTVRTETSNRAAISFQELSRSPVSLPAMAVYRVHYSDTRDTGDNQRRDRSLLSLSLAGFGNPH